MSKDKINSKTSIAIRTYVKQGYSANKIQKKLQSQVWVFKEKSYLLRSEKSREQSLRLSHKNILLGNIEGLRQKQEDQFSEENILQSIDMQQLTDTERLPRKWACQNLTVQDSSSTVTEKT